MKSNKGVFISLLLVILFSTKSNCQTAKTISALEDKYQSCLDLGQNMYGCSKKFYLQMDSMLNVVYKKVLNKSDSSNKMRLRSEQRKWIIKRDSCFAEIDTKFKNRNSNNETNLDNMMFIMDEKAKFVQNRVLELIKMK